MTASYRDLKQKVYYYATFDLSKDKTETSWEKQYRLYKGIFLGMLSGILFAFVTFLAKVVKDVHADEKTLARYFVSCIFLLPSTIYTREPIFSDRRLFTKTVAAGCIAAFNVFARYRALQLLPLATVIVIVFSSPVLIAILGRIFRKESCSLLLVASLLITSIGTLLVVELPFQPALLSSTEDYSSRIYGILWALLSMTAESIECLIISYAENCNMISYSFETSVFTFIVSLVLCCSTNHLYLILQLSTSWELIFHGLFSCVGDVIFVRSLQIENAGAVSIARSVTDILLSYLLQIVYFYDIPSYYSVGGATLVIIGAIILYFNKWWSAKSYKIY